MQSEVCVNFLGGDCPAGQTCTALHHYWPFMWRVQLPGPVWNILEQEGPDLETAYCDPKNSMATIQPSATSANTQVTSSDTSPIPTTLHVDFTMMLAQVAMQPPYTTPDTTVPLSRVSTPSYVTRPVDPPGRVSTNYHTQWRWYWDEGSTWKPLGDDIQPVLEKKFLYGQEVYRFETEVSLGAASQPANHVFLLNFRHMSMTCISQPSQPSCQVKRRPLLCTAAGQVPCLEVKEHPFASEIPENWVPVDTTHDYELVPLNPESMEYHLVASEVQRSIPTGRQICDVFRLQNPFLWHKFSSKKKFMEHRRIDCKEHQLFHGTSDEMAVQAICKQNFDWRLCGKNNVVYGRGSYFAQDSAYSDKYSGQRSHSVRWMFMARVLVGRYTKGNNTLVRPPPLDPTKPHGDLYDSCVDNVQTPKVFVIFDCDQCYPEFLISYRLPL